MSKRFNLLRNFEALEKKARERIYKLLSPPLPKKSESKALEKIPQTTQVTKPDFTVPDPWPPEPE